MNEQLQAFEETVKVQEPQIINGEKHHYWTASDIEFGNGRTHGERLFFLVKHFQWSKHDKVRVEPDSIGIHYYQKLNEEK